MTEAHPSLEYQEIHTGPDPIHSVIWLHGLGANGLDFEPVVPQLGLRAEHSVRFLFPDAPLRPITADGGKWMRGWYDIYDIPVDTGSEGATKQDREGLEDSAALVQGLIAVENRRGVQDRNIILAGFSQGGATVLFTALRLPQKIAGVVALSTYLPVADSTNDERSAANQDTPIFFGHGTQDPMIPFSAAQQSRDQLQQMGYQVDWNSYDIPHAVHPREIQDIGRFIKATFGFDS